MNRVHVKLLMMVAAGTLLFSNSIVAQENPYSPKEILPPAPKVARVQITQGPELEMARTDWAIIRWTTNNPGGTDEHDGIVHYGTNPNELNQTAKSPIHINRSHSDAIFRVRVLGLSPHTKYYYTVEATEATGTSDGVKSSVKYFTTQ
ncbi:MAG TPA: fibronectin type III domain-containing protein [Candidatus Deferrimicrobiaceae bacterium]|jgi:phosphodiesterase/alkaline phosphatase D-like protein|nr:fibronectin type III domain-containing protein [Candidatus Deferrimicrobiaceae bacterium]